MKDNPRNNSFIKFGGDKGGNIYRFSHNAMATVFEIIINHEGAGYAEQCAYSAFSDLDRLELELSRFIDNSDISRINSSGANSAVSVGPDTFACLELCARLSANTKNVFDVTAGNLIKYWSGRSEVQGNPDEKEELERARKNTGMHLVYLDKSNYSVTLKSDNICIDLGGFGKGYAVDKMAEILLDWGIDSALIHGGTSSALALGAPPGENGWEITLRNPGNYDSVISRLYLKNMSVNGSGIQKGGHIIDIHTACPVKDRSAAWAVCKNAAEGDALSTAFMIMTPEEIKEYCNNNDVSAAIITKESGKDEKILRFGNI